MTGKRRNLADLLPPSAGQQDHGQEQEQEQTAAAPPPDSVIKVEADNGSASAGAGISASGNESEKGGGIDSGKRTPADSAHTRPAPSTWRPPRRVGRPRGPERVPLSVRILAELDARLTDEVQRQELSPQFIVDQALADYFARLDRARQRVDGQKPGVSASGNASGSAGGTGS